MRPRLQNEQGINRYMLGCKYIPGLTVTHLFLELIDTCWDVNMHILEHLKRFRLRINRYMLGCKFNSMAKSSIQSLGN